MTRRPFVAVAATLALLGGPAPVSAAEPRTEPAVAPRPAWFTPDLERRVATAARDGEGIPVPGAVAAGGDPALSLAGIRPGTWMVSPHTCTLNFVFGRGSTLSIGTAGHCGKVGDEVTAVLLPGLLVNIGRVVLSNPGRIGTDFGLIRIRPEMRRLVNPTTAYLGGPTASAAPSAGDLIAHVGHGAGLGTGGVPRVGVVTYARGAGGGFGWLGAGSPGDSGGPVLRDGRAVGCLTHVLLDGRLLPATVAGTPVATMIRLAGLPLVTGQTLRLDAETPATAMR